MNDFELESKFERVISVSDLKKLQDIAIYEDDDGTYKLFGIYFIKKGKHEYVVGSTSWDQTFIFGNIKNAVSWCTFHKRNKLYEANRIIELDRKLGTAELEIKILKRKFSKAETLEEKLIYLAKLNESKLKKVAFNEELYSFVMESRNWQERRFNPKPAH